MWGKSLHFFLRKQVYHNWKQRKETKATLSILNFRTLRSLPKSNLNIERGIRLMVGGRCAYWWTPLEFKTCTDARWVGVLKVFCFKATPERWGEKTILTSFDHSCHLFEAYWQTFFGSAHLGWAAPDVKPKCQKRASTPLKRKKPWPKHLTKWKHHPFDSNPHL